MDYAGFFEKDYYAEIMILDNYRVSYAQNREDVIIEAFFPDVEKGFYVDVGANDPKDDSVTKLFYDEGWHGVNIEPSPRLLNKLNIERKRDINVGAGVASIEGILQFREYHNHGLSTFSDKMKKVYEQEIGEKTATFSEYKVAVRPLSKILDDIKPKHIHFLKVDVEGYEYEVLASNDWIRYRPELICIEANHIIKDWHGILKKANYNLVFNDGLNEYFLAHESMARLDKFNYAESIVLGKQIINPGLAKLLSRYDRLLSTNIESKLQKFIFENGQLEVKNAQLQMRINNLEAEISHRRGLRKLMKELYTETDSFILRTIDRRGYSKKKPKVKKVDEIFIDNYENLTTHELLDIVKSYDVKSYFRFHTSKSGMKLRYRIASKTYRVTRDLGKKVAVKSYHQAKRSKG